LAAGGDDLLRRFVEADGGAFQQRDARVPQERDHALDGDLRVAARQHVVRADAEQLADDDTVAAFEIARRLDGDGVARLNEVFHAFFPALRSWAAAASVVPDCVSIDSVPAGSEPGFFTSPR